MRKTITALVLVALLAGVSVARPWKTPVIDGTITGDGLDWDSDDLVVDDPLGDTAWGPNDIDDLWVTWDADNLYIGLRYQVSNNAMLVLLDTRDGIGASDINGIDWYARNFNFPDSVRADIIIAGWDGGLPNVRRILDNSTTEDLTTSCAVANLTKTDFFREMEVSIPWEVLYLGDPGSVDSGAKIHAVALIAGGDNWNGPDSAPDNPGMDGSGSATTLINYYTDYIDANGDGTPDTFEGSISGSITLGDPLDTGTVPTVELYYESSDLLVDRITLPAGGGPYTFGRLRDDSYRVEAFAPGYARLKEGRLEIAGQNSLSGIDIELTRAGKVTGNVSFADGPGYAATVTPYDLATGLMAGEGAFDIPDTGGDFLLLLPQGDYEIVTEARGYVTQTRLATVTGSDSTHVADIGLNAVRATRLVLTDGYGNDIESVSTTVSYPDSGIYFYASCVIEARDEEGRRDWYDVAGYLDLIDLRATKLNNLTEPRGDVRFWGFDGDNIVQITNMTMYDGRGLFLVSGDEIEVLRVFTESAEGGLAGRFKVGIRSAEPEFIEISASPRQITADGEETVTVEARLLDISSNPVSLPGVSVAFSVGPGSTGSGTFAIPSSSTSADGTVSTTFTATGAGSIHITASAVYLNRDLVPLGEDGEDYVEITAVAGAAAGVRIRSDADVVGFGETLRISLQLVDAFGNEVREAGRTVTLQREPVSSGVLTDPSIVLDGNGYGETGFTAGSARAVVRVSASSPPLDGSEIAFEIDNITTISDPPFPEPDLGHSPLEAMDLTTVLVSNTAEYIDLRIRFDSNFDGAHLVILMEANSDEAGATADPFLFPVTYAHTLRPDYALTYKFSSDDYGDMRRWSGTEWEWWDDEGNQYISTSAGTWVAGIDIHSKWITRADGFVNYRIPLDFFEGSVPSTIRFQVYLTQEAAEGLKRSAFDSAPHDSTLNLDFDPANPEADWTLAEVPVTLNNWSDPYVVVSDFPVPPVMASPLATPSTIDAGGMVRFTVALADAGDGIGTVLIDLSPLGGSRYQFLGDEGTGGDLTAGDGIYSYLYIVPPDIAGGIYELSISARDERNISRSLTTATLEVVGTIEPLRILTDEIDDDHGPDQFGREGLYYLYPTNVVFGQGAFDLEEMIIFETSNVVGGEIIPSFAFQVKIGNLADPADEGTADWNPLYADINIQKVDIYIDAFKGGATEGLPNRQNDFTRWDAWDYAIIMEGWYKGVITSNNQNTPIAWAGTVRKSDRDIVLLTDFEANTMTAVVSRASLGDPSIEEIQDWDIMVLLTSHDGNSDDNNFGDTRWVNASTSEWNFGGGGDLDRDSNIIDLMASPGAGHSAGRLQSQLLDYKTDEAVARLESGETAVVLETSAFEDQGPPVITVPALKDETVPYTALKYAPLYFTAIITDDDQVASATFRWRADSVTTDDWMGELPMGYAGKDFWSVDLPIEEMLALVPIAMFDSTANIEFQIEAFDPSGNRAITPLITMEINPPVSSFTISGLDMTIDHELRGPEGTTLIVPSSAIPPVARDIPFLMRLTTHMIEEFPSPPGSAGDIGVIRTIDFEVMTPLIEEGTGDTISTSIPLPAFEHPVTLSLHYPQYSVTGMDEDLLGIYELNRTTGTWIYVGGTVNPYGNLITISISSPGTFAVFFNPDFGYERGEVFSGITFSPNPFSPNGDGLYEETSISFYLTTEATVTIEIFDMDGNRRRVLSTRVSFTAEDTPDRRPRRITGVEWDGRDNQGVLVPYGIYVARFTVTYQQAAGNRTIRRNAAVAVIR